MPNAVKSAERRRLLAVYGRLYRRHMDVDPGECFYCGEPRECLDHRPPLAALDDLGASTLRRRRIPLCLIPSCAECNKWLGDKPLLTASDAIAYLVHRMETTYEKRHQLWRASDIAEMSPMFRALIQAKQDALSGLHARLRFAQSRQLDDEIMPRYEAWDQSDPVTGHPLE